MTDSIEGPGALPGDERVLWSGRSRPAGAAMAVAPNLVVSAFAACLAFGFSPASTSMGIFLSPVVESALKTVSPLPVPQLFIERQQRPPAPRGPAVPIAFAPVPAAGGAPPPVLQPPASDVDMAVGVFLLVCKVLLLYLAGATAFLGLRNLSWQLSSLHAVTDLRVLSRRGGASESVALSAVRGIRRRRHPFGSSIAVDVGGRRRPFVLLGLPHAEAEAAERAIAAGLRAG